MKPFPHQEAVAQLVQEHDKGIFDIACGCGKSYSMMLSSKHFFVTVVFAPTKNLVSQLADNFATMSDVNVFMVNSDNQVNMTQLRRAKMSKKKRIVIVANYQSVHVVKETCDSLNLEIDVCFLDEAHNVTSDKKRSIFHKSSDEMSDCYDIDADNESLLSDSDVTEETVSESDSSGSTEKLSMSDIMSIVAKKTFSFTATPTKTMLKHPEIYGPVLLRYTYAQGVLDGHVKNIDTIIECYGDNDTSCLDAGYERLIPAISRFIHSGDFKRIIVYTSRVKDTGKKMATVNGLSEKSDLFTKEFKIHAVTADTPPVDRNSIFDTFRTHSEETHVILSCMTISEGIDLPSCDAVVILDSSKSVVKIIQRTLRACRLTSEERLCGEWRNAAVFYPINVPETSFIELLNAGRDEAKEVLTNHVHRHEFEFAMAVVHFLKQDLELEVLFDFTCTITSKNKGSVMPRLQGTRVSGSKKPTTNVSFQLSDVIDWTAQEFNQSITYLATNMRYISFEESFYINLEELKKFISENQRLPSVMAKEPKEKKLGQWCSERRKEFKNNKLVPERISDLEKIDMWSWDPFEDEYARSLELLKKFVSDNKRLPSTVAKEPNEKKLGVWCNSRRKEFKNNKLVPERIADLEKVDMWSWDPIADEYARSLEFLKKFISDKQRLPSQNAKEPNEKKLGKWCSNRRKEFKNNKLIPERIAELEKVDMWSWNPFEDEYARNLEELKKFVGDKQRLPSENAKEPNEKKLGSWCSSRRKEFKNNKLIPERIADLEKVDIWSWDPFEDEYARSLEELKKFVGENQRLPSENAKEPNEKKLGSWCSNRRKEFKNNKLVPERIADLEKVDMWSWNPFEDEYVRNLEQLKKFISEKQRLPSQTAKEPNEKKLGQWCSNRRTEFKNNKLVPERIADLEKIDMWSWDPIEDEYARSLEELKKFIRYKQRLPSQHAKEPNEKKLGVWCNNRRTDFKNNKLVPERIADLEKVDMWFWSKSTKTTLLPKSNPTPQTNPKKRKRELSELSEYHRRFKTMNSNTLHQEFQEDSELFHDYHQVAEQNWKTFAQEDRPVFKASQIIKLIHEKVNAPLNIVDFGAGVGTLKDLISPEHTLIGIDHVSVKDWIIARDMRDTELPPASQDICVFSMSLWGSNWEEYIVEASRVLKPYGYVIIVNKTRGWFVDETHQPIPEKETRIGNALIKSGFLIAKITGVDTMFTTCVAVKQPFEI